MEGNTIYKAIIELSDKGLDSLAMSRFDSLSCVISNKKGVDSSIDHEVIEILKVYFKLVILRAEKLYRLSIEYLKNSVFHYIYAMILQYIRVEATLLKILWYTI